MHEWFIANATSILIPFISWVLFGTVWITRLSSRVSYLMYKDKERAEMEKARKEEEKSVEKDLRNEIKNLHEVITSLTAQVKVLNDRYDRRQN